MSWVLETREVKRTQRAHKCEWCGEIIPKGSPSLRRAYTFQGDFHSAHMHLECQRALSGAPYGLVEEGWVVGEFERGSIESRE